MPQEFMPSGRHPKRILNEIKWRGLSLEDTVVEILHRGAINDRITARASQIQLLKGTFMLGESEIPYHRITRITYQSRVVFDRFKR